MKGHDLRNPSVTNPFLVCTGWNPEDKVFVANQIQNERHRLTAVKWFIFQLFLILGGGRGRCMDVATFVKLDPRATNTQDQEAPGVLSIESLLEVDKKRWTIPETEFSWDSVGFLQPSPGTKFSPSSQVKIGDSQKVIVFQVTLPHAGFGAVEGADVSINALPP